MAPSEDQTHYYFFIYFFTDEFERSEAIRKSKRVAAIGNLINSSNIMKAQPIMRSSWGGSCEDLYFDRGSGFSSHSQSPSSSRETSPVLSKKDLVRHF